MLSDNDLTARCVGYKYYRGIFAAGWTVRRVSSVYRCWSRWRKKVAPSFARFTSRAPNSSTCSTTWDNLHFFRFNLRSCYYGQKT